MRAVTPDPDLGAAPTETIEPELRAQLAVSGLDVDGIRSVADQVLTEREVTRRAAG